MKNIYEIQSENKIKSAIILILFFIFIALTIYFLSQAYFLYTGYQFSGIGLVGIALIISGIMSFSSYYFSDKIILTISKAKPADRIKDFNFYTICENLAIGMGIPKPKLYVINDSAPNAFATGRNPQKAVICATSGLLSKLNRTELEGVFAHELTHIINYDIRLMSIVSVLVGSIALMSDWFLRMSLYGKKDSDRKSGQIDMIIMILGVVFALLSPLIAQLIKLAISRRRELMADSGSVSITRQPQGLISALKKISLDQEPLEVANKATAHLYIENPFKNNTSSTIKMFSGLFNTHPPVEERIKALNQMV